jgi:DNA-binding response OmpR family regulator
MNAGETMILVVDDDDKLISLLQLYLKREGFRVIAARDGAQALDLFDRHQPHFIILDVMLPRIDGISVCRRIRETSRVPILMLSAKVEEKDKVVGLQAGADDYVSKPFSPQELVARVRTILRRAGPSAGRLIRGSLVIDVDRHEVFVEGREVRLTAIEFKLLRTLMESPGRVFTRDQLLTTFHGFGEAVVDRAIDVHIGRLREKLGDDPTEPRFIQTVRGFGYKLLESERAG